MKQPVKPHTYLQELGHEIGNCIICGSDLEADGRHLDANGSLIPVDDPFNVLGSEVELLEINTNGSTKVHSQRNP